MTSKHVIMIMVRIMRLKHVKGASEEIEKCPYVVHNAKEHKGQFNKLFGNNNPIHIEIGMGKGNFIIENAKRYPDINFIGIEKYDSVIVRAVQKLEVLELPNLRLVRCDATYIEDIFDKEITTIYLNFSDPWPKARHERRRLTSSEFLKKYDNLFKDKKHIIQKTDNRNLFEFSVKSFTDYGYKIDMISLNLHEDIEIENIETEYEQKFVSRGSLIYKIEVSKE